jgi:putative transcriptional regulator
MRLQAGIFLKSTPALNDTYFAGSMIFITEYNTNGAVGFVINRHFGRSLNELEEFKHSPAFLLYEGGPVDQEHLFFLHQRPDLIDEGMAVRSGIYSGGNFKQAVTLINNKSLSPKDIKLFIGYCGWDQGELEAEIEEGSWQITDANYGHVFDMATN